MNELERDLKERLRHKPILLMTHLICVGSGHYVERRRLEKDLTDLLSFTQWGRSMGIEPDSVEIGRAHV